VIRGIAAGAARLDAWLQAKLGRPYNAVLTVGILTEIIRRLTEAPKQLGELHHLLPIIGLTAVDLALLIHQVGELSHRIERRRKARDEADTGSRLHRRGGQA
jgi:hypothetical protein